MNKDKIKIIKLLNEELNKRFSKDYELLKDKAYQNFDKLVLENIDDPKALKKQEYGNMFPAISYYLALIDFGISKDKAYNFIYDVYIYNATLTKEFMQKVCKTKLGLRLMPTFWKISAKTGFNEKATFTQKFYKTDSYRCKFDMLACPFDRICKKYNVPELTKIFCKTDDVGIIGVHERLIWNRTKTIGNGDNLCDFDVILKKKEK